jgi:hypothetical protein
METESGKFHWSKIPLRGVLFPMVVARPHNHQNDSPPSPSPPLTSYSRHFHWFLHLTPSLYCNVSCLLGISKIGSFPQLTVFLPLQLRSAHQISFPTHCSFSSLCDTSSWEVHDWAHYITFGLKQWVDGTKRQKLRLKNHLGRRDGALYVLTLSDFERSE